MKIKRFQVLHYDVICPNFLLFVLAYLHAAFHGARFIPCTLNVVIGETPIGNPIKFYVFVVLHWKRGHPDTDEAEI